MRTRLPALAIGAVFGAMLCWTGMSNPDVIREALRFTSAYLYLFMGAAVATAAVGLRILRARRERAVLTDTPLSFTSDPPERRHVVGGLLFGIGWGVADVCPGPVLVQVGQGIGWGAVMLVGVLAGIHLHERRGAADTEPAADAGPDHRPRAATRRPVATPAR